MKLTIEHLAAYLPYGLKGFSREENLGVELVKGYSTYSIDNEIYLITNVGDIDIELFQPLLRPLSYLTKEIEHNGERFVPIEKLQSNKGFEWRPEIIHLCSYQNVQKLLSWHFDIFGLIESGLAIPIKPIDNEQDRN